MSRKEIERRINVLTDYKDNLLITLKEGTQRFILPKPGVEVYNSRSSISRVDVPLSSERTESIKQEIGTVNFHLIKLRKQHNFVDNSM